MFHPFIDTKSLSDEELIDKLKQANSYMNYEMSMGRIQTVESIRNVVIALETERANRQQDRQMQEAKKHTKPPLELGKLQD
jgi:hypothetical protein